jgi:hypothetical protein
VNRRQFLLYSAGFAASGFRPSPARASTSCCEGLYGDQFTYRAGVESIDLRVSLLDWTTVEISIRHLDHPSAAVVGVFSVPTDDAPMPFPVRLSLDTTDMEPGLYEAAIDPLVMRSENRENQSGIGFTSHNHVFRFVVTVSVPGSYSNLLWLHDSLTPTAYGGFGGESIYPSMPPGSGTVGVRTISWRRPGLDTPLDFNRGPLRRLKSNGYRFEFMDAIAFSEAPGSIVDPYSLIVVQGQFEYLPHAFMSHLKQHIANGGRLLLSANEFAIFRVRLDESAGTMTTYKWDSATEDPVSGVERTGVSMHNPDTIWETELAGLATWPTQNLGSPRQDMTICHPSETGWLFEGTGFSDAIPSCIWTWSAGNRGVLSGNQFDIFDAELSRTPSDTLVWGAVHSTDGRMWDQGLPGQESYQWPVDPNGYALCTLRELGNGARVIGMAGHQMLQHNYYRPGHDRLFDNIFAYLTAAAPVAVPALGPIGLTVATCAMGEIGRRTLAKR